MRRTFTLFLVTWVATTLGFAQLTTYNLPHLATGSYSQGSIRTTFVLFNNGDQDADVQITARDNSGDPLVLDLGEGESAGQFDLTLPAGQTRFLQSGGTGPLREGSAVVRSSTSIGVSAIFSIYDRNGNYLTESGISTAELLDRAHLAIDVDRNSNTGVALQNPLTETVTVTFHAFGADGFAVAGPVVRDLPPNGHMGVFVGGTGGLFPELIDFRGVLSMEASATIAALTLRQNSAPLSFTTLPVTRVDSNRSSFMLPQIANGGGVIKTTFVLFGLGTSDNFRPGDRIVQSARRTAKHDADPFFCARKRTDQLGDSPG